jgi:hypothetical protein
MAFLLAGAALIGCSQPSDSAEKRGERLDSAIEETRQGETNLGDGPFERAGEEIDEAVEEAQQQAEERDAATRDAQDPP